ncbi:cutinase family protein [Kutzneria sp. CA-103260]|uniref:cutinase family protein n=1 Tax=Kutzneria sp. CA-103260 TaxID=2802641 RepID=UPI001BF033A3|nr:cutinase family protein [Kutzneria sp. CA-103260]QUQ64763.1 serine esterase, cutinase [Kutzneria sp. CA-103260]
MNSFLSCMRHRPSTLLVASTIALFGATGLSTAVAPTASAAVCADVDVGVARGTFEPGNLGLIVGDRVFSALRHTLPSTSLSGYRVNYPASLDQPASVQQGNTDLVAHVRTRAAACPRERFVLVGYSQGANVVDNALGVSSAGALVGGPIVAVLPASVELRVAAVLLFGSPGRRIGRSITGVYQNRTKDYCAHGDPVCQNGGLNPLAHFSYGSDAADAAAFAASKL